MQSKTWIELFEHIPKAFRDGFGIATASGIEVNLESILRLEEEFMVFRGRLMGTTEAQRTFFLPYNQINLLIYQRLMKEEDVQAWFGGAPVPVVSTAASENTETPGEPEPAEPAPVPEPVPQTPMPVQRMDSAPLPGKAAILERLRSKRANASSQGTSPKPQQ